MIIFDTPSIFVTPFNYSHHKKALPLSPRVIYERTLNFKLFLKFVAFGGDISCDFETEQWDEGFCNWRYDFASTDVFTWETSPESDLSLKKRWQYGKIFLTYSLKLRSNSVITITVITNSLTIKICRFIGSQIVILLDKPTRL